MRWVMLLLTLISNGQVSDLPLQTNVPTFEMWVECINRGPYVGRADADLSYRYDGAFAIMAEDSRFYGDIGTDYIQLMPMAIEPGEHKRFTTIHVGAMKAVLWKVVFLDELHVVAVWDDPDVPDCGWEVEATPTPPPQGEGSISGGDQG